MRGGNGGLGDGGREVWGFGVGGSPSSRLLEGVLLFWKALPADSYQFMK